MTSAKQIAANRRNALHSTGPRTEKGKDRSRRNALRHGLTAQTVIGVFENPKDYQAFESAIVRDMKPRTTVERQLVWRLVSLLWRLRRATAIETGLFRIQGEQLPKNQQTHGSGAPDVFRRLLGATENDSRRPEPQSEIVVPDRNGKIYAGCENHSDRKTLDLARCFLRLSNFNDGAFDRIGRYEAALWRQTAQVLFALTSIRR